jgi:uncharacterized protein YlxP (DUF503 family)
MFYAVCRFEIHIPQSRSLKSKRSLMNRIKGRLQSRYRVSVAEVGCQDLWQRGVLGVALAGCQPGALREQLESMRRLVELEDRCELLEWSVHVGRFESSGLRLPIRPDASASSDFSVPNEEE